MSDDYERLERAERAAPRRVVDHSAAWAKLTPLADVNGSVRERVEAFCADKRITLAALAELGTRVVVERQSGGVALAFAYPAHGGSMVPAIKFRPLGSDRRRYAASPSTFLEPLVVGNRDGLDWFCAEGETDAARLVGLVGDVAAVVCLPAGALTFKRDWAARIPRGASVYLCHDADEAGDKGAEKAARIIGGRTIRLRPPIEGGDWCEWPGDRDAFVELVRAQRAQRSELEPLNLAELLAGPLPETPWLWRGWLARGELVLVVADPKVGKSLLALGLATAVRLGEPFLGSACERGRVGFLDFENPLGEVQRRLRSFGLSAGDVAGLSYFHMPTLDLTTPAAEQTIAELVSEHELDLLVVDSARRAAPGLDENDSRSVSGVFTPLRRVSAQTEVAIAVIHHARKRIGDNPTDAGQMVRGSGDLVASVDALIYLRAKEAGSFTLETVARRGLPHEPILVRIEHDEERERVELVNAGPVAYADDKVEAMLARILGALEIGPLERQVIALRVEADAKSSTFSRALNLGYQREQLAKQGGSGRPTIYSLVYREAA